METTLGGSLSQAAAEILTSPEPAEKARLTGDAVSAWRRGSIRTVGQTKPPDRPARPPRPELRPAREVARRRINSQPAGRLALLHALAHIELNAIDLAWDIIARFSDLDLPRDFYDDWLRVAEEEAKHFLLLEERLAALGGAYGDFPAHDGLWQAATATAHDLLARLAVVPLVLEARGLDVTPAMIAKLRAVGDEESAQVLEVIYEDEIGHVAVGKRWFDHIAQDRGEDPKTAWQGLVRRYFKGSLKPPFNEAGRDAANFPFDFYGGLVG